jgi:ArsR family transcriptional regulator, arsenate/arsenite/antimonite-responsive transcriptional repressor
MQIFTYPFRGMKTIIHSVKHTAEVIRVLGHPVRIEILRLLVASNKNELTVKEIHETLEITQPEASKHLIAMKNQAIVVCNKKDGYSYYSINENESLVLKLAECLKNC